MMILTTKMAQKINVPHSEGRRQAVVSFYVRRGRGKVDASDVWILKADEAVKREMLQARG